MSEVLDVIAKRSSIKAYTDEKLTKEEIEALVTAGLQAPTARNSQEIHISVLDGSNPLLGEIEAEKRAFFAAQAVNEEARGQILNATSNFYYNAPTVLILSAEAENGWREIDAGIAVENIALAAQSLGLGNVILGVIKGVFTGERKAYFENALQFPEGYAFAIAIAVGHTAAGKEPHAINLSKDVSFLK